MKALKILTLILMLSIGAQAEETQPIKIGWIGPLTGNAAALGVDSVPAIQMVFDRVNKAGGIHGRPLKLIVEDDQYITAKTVSAYQKLVHQQNIKILYIITYGGLFAIAEKAQKDEVLLLDPLDCDDAIAALPENVLCVSKKTEEMGEIFAVHATEHKHTPAGILYFNGDPFMGIAAKATIKKFKELGSEVAYSEGYIDDGADFKTMLIKAKSKGIKSLFFFGYDQMGYAAKQAKQMGINAQFYSLNTINSPGFKELAGDSIEGTYVASWLAPRTERYNEFLQKFVSKVGREPFLEISTVPSYDIAEMLAEAFLQGTDTKTVQSFLYGIKKRTGLSGIITIDPDGITRSLRNKMYIFNNGSLEEIS